jgi:hypothetical protein
MKQVFYGVENKRLFIINMVSLSTLLIDLYVFALFCGRLFRMMCIKVHYLKKVDVFGYPNTKFNRFAGTKAIII